MTFIYTVLSAQTWIFAMAAEMPCSAADWTLWTAAPNPGAGYTNTGKVKLCSAINKATIVLIFYKLHYEQCILVFWLKIVN